MVEKPSPETAPSTLAVVGRYVLSAGIFDALEHTGRGAGSAIQLTYAIASLPSPPPIDAHRSRRTPFACGSPSGLVEMTILFSFYHQTTSHAGTDTTPLTHPARSKTVKHLVG